MLLSHYGTTRFQLIKLISTFKVRKMLNIFGLKLEYYPLSLCIVGSSFNEDKDSL